MENFETIEVRVYGHRVQIKVSHTLLGQLKGDPQIFFEKTTENVLRQMFETVLTVGFNQMFNEEKVK